MERIFNGMLIAAGIIGGIAFGLIINAKWPQGLPPDSTLTVAAAVIGALGTWAVGIGAMHYAQQAHRLRLSEIETIRLHEFVRVRATLINCQMAIGIWERMLEEGAGRTINTKGMRTALRAIVSLLPTAPISAAGILKDEDRMLSHPVDITSTLVRITAEQFMETYGETFNPRHPDLLEQFDLVISNTKTLRDMAGDLAARLDEQFKARRE